MSWQQGGKAWRDIGVVKRNGKCHTLRGGEADVQEEFYYLVPADTSEEVALSGFMADVGIAEVDIAFSVFEEGRWGVVVVRVFEGEKARVYIARDEKLHEHGEDRAMRLCTHGGFEPMPGTYWTCTSELCSGAEFTGSCYRNLHDRLED